MKIIVKRCGKFESGRAAAWVALKDKQGIYHCHVDGSHRSKNIILAGHLIYWENKERTINNLIKEGHNR